MNRFIYLVLLFVIALPALSQNSSPDAIRKQMAKIRQTTNWNDPAAAKKANEEIQKLARQMTGQPASTTGQNAQQKSGNIKPGPVELKTAATKENVLAIADRFYKRSYKNLDAMSKFQFDQDFKAAEKDKFSLKAVKNLASTGATLITFGDSHDFACVYLTAALKAKPDDTLAANNFGGYLRIIDSTVASLPVLLYANQLFDKSPVILTQIGCSYFELKDYKQAESYLKEALKYNPGFGQAHTALCEMYIQQNRLQDALIELFAGVKGMMGGCSYMQASQSFAYMQQQAENSDTKEDFWDETRKQVNPEDALAPLVPEVSRLKMPAFGNCLKVADWMEGGGYTSAVQGFDGFHDQDMKFTEEFLQVHKEVPALPPNAILRDYPSERFALDCITEYFFQKSADEANDYEKKMDEIMKHAFEDEEVYLHKHEGYIKTLAGCLPGCSNDYCVKECYRKYCMMECPAANDYNQQLQVSYDDYRSAFTKTVDNQKKILDDLYGFSEQWFSKIQSPYWSKIYAYEIQRVALTIIANAYEAYPRAFPSLAHNECGTDCSVFMNPYPMPPEEVDNKKPKENECPEGTKVSLGIGFCGIDLECESIEFGCSAGASLSVKRDFKNKSTTLFVGAGGELELIGAGAEIKAGATITKYDSGDTDIGGKFEMSGTVGSGVKVGRNYEMTATVMEGARVEGKNVIGVGL